MSSHLNDIAFGLYPQNTIGSFFIAATVIVL